MHRRVALIAYSLRFPGTDTQHFWRDLLAQKDLVTEVDPTRWSKDGFLHPDKRHPGSSYTFAAGSLGDISGFDAAFFGISPREAALMDPQQRMLLELAWETFENAGIVPSSLRGSDCGVYVGISNVDYAYRLADDLAAIDAAAATGIISSIAANRISYVFDLHGPSISMDTACSSSLVAFHQACLAIRSGEISQALAGGINLHLHPYGFISFSKATMLSKTGRCHVFDEAGDGYVRSEGGGLFLLKDYEQALADGDPILAEVAGSAINTDGHKSGLTIPNPDAQAALMARVYQQAGIAPDAIDYFEAHGTGTAVGDPIETHAIGLALGQKRNTPLLIGSVKSNLGHLESASGVAGVVKALLCIQHRKVPATISVKHLNPKIDCADWNLRIATDNEPLKPSGDLVIGVNSFGFGGANAHVILRGGVSVSLRSPAQPNVGKIPLVWSAKDPAALKQTACDLADFLEQTTDAPFYDSAYTAMFRRERHALGAVVFSEGADDAASQLRQFAETGAWPGVYTGNRIAGAQGPVFVYAGNGCQWHGMGKPLLAHSEIFRKTIANIDDLFSQYADFSLLDALAGNGDDRYDCTEFAQPALFALQVGVTEVLKAQGVRPAAVLGHSVGEVAAAWAAGALSLPAAVKVIFYRSHYQGRTKGSGGMTAVGLGAADMMSRLSAYVDESGAPQLHLAGANSHRGVTVAGAVAALAKLESELAASNIAFKRLALDYAFHSPAMDAIEAGVCADLAALEINAAQLPFFSTVTGALLRHEKLDARYWWYNIRQPVQFQQAVSALLDDGFNVLVEIGAHPILQSYLNDGLKAAERPGVVIPTLTKTHDTLAQLQGCAAQVLLSGVGVNDRLWFPVAGRLVGLPNYPFQREKLWHPITSESCGLLTRQKTHPLLGYPLAQHESLWENQLDTRMQPFLADHNVGGAIVFPGAGFAELALAVAVRIHAGAVVEVEELEIRAPLLLAHDHSKLIRLQLETDGRFTVRSRDYAKSSEWQQHCVGRILGEAGSARLAITAPALPDRTPDFDRDSHRRLTDSVGIEYGPAFQALSHGWVDGNQAYGLLTLPDSIQADFDSYHLHPVLLDSAFQLVFQILKDVVAPHDGYAFVPVKIGKLYLGTAPAVPVSALARLKHQAPHSLNTEFALFAADGSALAVASDVRFRAVRLHRPHAQHLSYLDYHLTAAPMPATGAVAGFRSQNVLAALTAAATPAVLRYGTEVEPLLDSLCLQFIHEALAAVADAEGLLTAASIDAHRERYPDAAALLAILIKLAEDAGLLAAVGDISRPDWRLEQPDDESAIAAIAIWNTLVQDYPDYFYPIHVAGRIGMQLPRLLRSELKPEDLGLSATLYGHLTSHILEQTAKKDLMQALLAECRLAMQQLPTGERLGIIEISAYKPEFAPLLYPQLDTHQADYCFASFTDEALNAAQGLRDHFPLLRMLNLGDEPADAIAPASVAIVHVAMSSVSHVRRLLARLPTLLAPGASVLLIGLQPARWFDLTLGIADDWWLKPEGQTGVSPQLSAADFIDELQALSFTDVRRHEFMPAQNAGAYLLTARLLESTSAGQLDAGRQHWSIVASAAASERLLAERIAEQLRLRGQHALVQTAEETIDGLRSANAEDDAYLHIVHLSGFGSADDAAPTERCWLAAQLIQALETHTTDATVWLLTHQVGALLPCDQAHAFPSPTTLVNDAALWGFGRSLMNEASNYRVRLLDVSAAADAPGLPDAVVAALLSGSAEQEVFLNADGKRFAPRLRSRDRLSKATHSELNNAGQTQRLSFKLPGQLRNLHWQVTADAALADDGIEVDVKATGLNFRDIMYTLGLLSDEAVENGFVGPTLGLEFAGVVARTGSKISAFKPGDAVVGMGPASFSNKVLTKANAVALLPDGMSFAGAATIPSTFFTVYYALHYQARLQPGEKVLIHGAAGGVGIAAIQVAQWLGADIYATVGSDEKRDFLRLLGVQHIYDSRSLKFAEDILAQTDNRGVDVVLNSLAGEAINRNFQVLKPFGRFLELGKRDFYENTAIGLRPFRNNISYFGIDADQLMQEKPELTRRLFADMMQLFHDGVLHPLPYTVFDANQVVEAFRYMQQARHIGKIVVTYDNGIYAKPASSIPSPSVLALPANASYLVTGGLRGFGLRTAQWLVDKGARHLILISRSGPVAEEAQRALAVFAAQGVAVHAAACDVADAAAVAALLKHCAAVMPPLKGVIHAAAVIDDSLARNLSREQIARVLTPKIQGAKVLHALTQDLALDMFVLYSSVTTLFGNPGQSNYVAANLWLEGFAAFRRQQGLAATCVCWGAIDDAGYLTRNEKIKEALQSRMGGAALPAATALAVLERLLTKAPTQVAPTALGVMEFDWRALSAFLPTARTPKFHELALQAPHTDSGDDHRADIKRLLDELSDAELRDVFVDMLKDELSQILLVNKDKIDPNHPMHDMGLDSLMGVELMIAIEARFDTQVPVMALSEAPTLNKLADRLIAQLRGDGDARQESGDTLQQIRDLSQRHDSAVTQEQLSALVKAVDADGVGRIIH